MNQLTAVWYCTSGCMILY